MSRTETLKPKSHWDFQDAAVLIGLVSVVVGVAMFSLGAALVVGGLALTGLSLIWPTQ